VSLRADLPGRLAPTAPSRPEAGWSWQARASTERRAQAPQRVSVLADAVESGEAPTICKVAICMSSSRSRAVQEATEEYRRRARS
jgi:hypothetical protein